MFFPPFLGASVHLSPKGVTHPSLPFVKQKDLTCGQPVLQGSLSNPALLGSEHAPSPDMLFTHLIGYCHLLSTVETSCPSYVPSDYNRALHVIGAQ